ncbi:hypothetical protein ACIRD6_31455 [Streptomyces sp. NPDC102473]|uniref:hypothetical protein n=1 Tax=Streptomyces sp. NPDC102473 TaxID=3366180 RepID=UPI0037FA016A
MTLPATRCFRWTPARREAYANDLDAERFLVAVPAKTNRSKADQEPCTSLPLPAARCACSADWVPTSRTWQRSRWWVPGGGRPALSIGGKVPSASRSSGVVSR